MREGKISSNPRDSSIKQQMLFSPEVCIYPGSAVTRWKKSQVGGLVLVTPGATDILCGFPSVS